MKGGCHRCTGWAAGVTLLIGLAIGPAPATAQRIEPRSAVGKQPSVETSDEPGDARSKEETDAPAQQYFFATRPWTVSWGASTGHDDNVLADRGAGSDSLYALGGTWQSADVGLRLVDRGRHATLVTNAEASGRYYQDVTSLNSVEGEADVGVALEGRKSQLFAVQRVRRQPYYEFKFPGSAPFDWSTASGSGDFLTPSKAFSTEGQIGLTEKVGRGATFAVDYGYRHTTVVGSEMPFLWQATTMAYRRRLWRYAGVHLGYGFNHARDGMRRDSPQVHMHTIDAGVDLSRPLSHSRRTTVMFRSGSSLVSYQSARAFRLLGQAGLSRAIGRSWNATAVFRRDVSFHEQFIGPLSLDVLEGSAGGAMSSRLRMQVLGTFGQAERDFVATRGRYTTRGLGTELAFAVTRTVSLVTRYGFYSYGFGEMGAQLGSLPAFHRQSLRISVSGSF